MPGRFVYWMNVSLDLFIDGAAADEPAENGGGDWMRITESLHREFNRRAAALTLDVSGRKMYELMDPFWPNARTDESLPDYLREYGEIWVDTPKILVSRTRHAADFDTRVIGADGDALEQLARVRAEGTGDIGVGGATLATQLLHAHLLDEIMLFTHPVVLGQGRPLFDRLEQPLQLDLLEQQQYEDGVTLHRYAVRGALSAA